MQPGDYLVWGDYVLWGISTTVLLFASARAVVIGRAFTMPAYRGRAISMATFMILSADSNGGSFIPLPNNFVASFIGELSFLAALLFVLIFVDRNLAVLREVDFFHTDTYRWSRVRRPLIVATTVVTAAILLVGFLPSTTSFQTLDGILFVTGVLSYFVVAAVSIGYGALALVSGARRSPDRTMRRFSRNLGIALALIVVSFTIWIPLIGAGSQIENFGSGLAFLISVVPLYFAVMSLSPLGRIEASTAEATLPSTTRTTLPSQPTAGAHHSR